MHKLMLGALGGDSAAAQRAPAAFPVFAITPAE